MKKSLLMTLLLTLVSTSTWAAKSFYKPNSWTYNSTTQVYTESGVGTWSVKHSKQTDNCILFWQDGFGDDPKSAPSLNGTSMTFDPDAVLQVAETCYNLNVNTLGFNSSNMMNKYKIIILMNYTDTWTCYGGGYDFTCSALWLNPATVKPAGSALAHEVGHSFHYMCYGEDSNYGATSNVYTGFHENWSGSQGQAIWETTANWQALQAYPNEWFTESGMSDVLRITHNYAWSHEWHRYQAYPFLTFLCEKYNDIKTVSDVWKTHRTGSAWDFNEALMQNKGLSASDLYKLYYDYAAKMATYDFTAPKNYWSSSYVGKFAYNCIKTATNTYQVAYSSCPQSTGFNIVPLTVPSSGTTVSVNFTALAPGSNLLGGDPKQYVNGETQYATTTATKYNAATYASRRGFRLGFVAYLRNGTRQYFGGDQVLCTGTGESTTTISCTVPSNTSKLFMIVVPALTSYIRHNWDENVSNDDMWPYRFVINNTTLGSAATVTNVQETQEGDTEIRTYTYDVERYTNKGYAGETINIADMSNALSWLGISDVSSATTYFINGSDGSKVANAMNTYDGWCDATGNACSWGSSACLCAKFTPATSNDLWICTMPGNDGTSGITYTATWALYYESGTTKKQVNFTFNVTMVDPPAVDLSELTLMNTYSYEITKQVASDYATSSIAVDASLLSDLGVTSLTTPTFACEMPNGDLTTQNDAGAHGFWLNSDGKKCDWGDADSRFYVDIDDTNLLVGQYPGKCVPGTPYYTTLYFMNESAQKYVKVELNLNITPLQLSDFTVVKSYDFSLTTDSVKLDFTTDSLALDVADIQTALGLTTLDNTKFYATRGVGEITAAYTANNGYYLNSEGYSVAYAEETARFFVETDRTKLTLGQKPGVCAAGDTYTTTLYLGDEATSKLVALNITYIIPGKHITLRDTDTEYNYHAGQYNVSVVRNLPAGRWLTFCAPFNIDKAQQTAMGIAEARELVGFDIVNGELVLQFDSISDGGAKDEIIREFKPCIIRMAEAKDSITMERTHYDALKTPTLTVTSQDGTKSVTMTGTFIQTDVPEDAYYLQNGELRHHTGADGTTVINGWRAYFTLSGITFGTKRLGDLNGDNQNTLSDLTQLVNIVNGDVSDYDHKVANVNGDGDVNSNDITAQVNIILGKAQAENVQCGIEAICVGQSVFASGSDDNDGSGTPE